MSTRANIKRTVAGAALVAAALLAAAPEAVACSTCFGNPESDMAKGAVWGVAVLFGIIGSVLTGIAGMSVFFLHRSRRLAQFEAGNWEAD
jgi:hypothetical protein